MDIEILGQLLRLLDESVAKEGTAPSPEASRSNSEVLGKALAQLKPLTPTQRLAIATERHIDDVCKERDRMAQQLIDARHAHSIEIQELRRELTVIIDAHRERLDWFEPHYEGLKRDYDNISSRPMGAGAGRLQITSIERPTYR